MSDLLDRDAAIRAMEQQKRGRHAYWSGTIWDTAVDACIEVIKALPLAAPATEPPREAGSGTPLMATDITQAQANELQDILRTLTNSGTALITSARELVRRYEALAMPPVIEAKSDTNLLQNVQAIIVAEKRKYSLASTREAIDAIQAKVRGLKAA